MNNKKRKLFLDKIKKIEPLLKKWDYYSNPGLNSFFRKISKLFIAPQIVFSRLLFYLKIVPKEKRINLLDFRKIILPIKDINAFSLSQFGLLFSNSEIKLTKFLIKNFKKDDIFYDIGSNYGFYTFLASEFCEETHSFEPIKNIFKYLKINFSKNNIYLNNVALSDKKGSIFLYLKSGMSSIIKEVKKLHNLPNDKVEVKTIKLDDYIKNHKKPTFVKLDVEGAENKVIKGGEYFLKNNNPIISLEVWPKNNGGKISKKAINLLKNLGYKSYIITNNGELSKTINDLPSIVSYKKMTGDNFIFKK